MSDLLEEIQLHYTGTDDFYIAHARDTKAWLAGQPIPPNHLPIGRIDTNPDLLRQVEAEISQFDPRLLLDNLQEPESRAMIRYDLPPLTASFIEACYTSLSKL